MRVILSNGDIRHWSDSLDWGVDDNGYLDIHNDDEIFASYPPGAWLGIEETEPKQPTETYRFAVYHPDKNIFTYIDSSIGSEYMITGVGDASSLILLKEGGGKIMSYANWSVAFIVEGLYYRPYQINPMANKSDIRSGFDLANHITFEVMFEKWVAQLYNLRSGGQ